MRKFYTNSVIAFLPILIALLSSCGKSSAGYVGVPLYTNALTPTVVKVRFPDAAKLPTLDYNIDNINKLIYNSTPYAYETAFDSAYLTMVVSTDCKVSITNELTKKVISWTARDTGKIEVKGGKLLIEVSRGSKTPVTYKMRMQIYGYNPNKYTWKRSTGLLPTTSEDGHVFTHNGQQYWLSRLGNTMSLYSITDIDKGVFAAVSATLPAALRPKTMVDDTRGGHWVLDDAGKVHYSDNLTAWEEVATGDADITGLLYQLSDASDSEVIISAIGHPTGDTSTYYTYTVSRTSTEKHNKIDDGAPVRNFYTYVYTRAGATNANIIGGIDKDGKPIKANYFTSDGIHWGVMPYIGADFSTPSGGALYLRLDNSITTVAGEYKGTAQNKIYRSQNRGLSWVELSKEEEPGSDFTARTGVSGTVLQDGEDVIYYLFGGLVDGKATSEYWKGYLDKTGGIINSIKE